MPLFKKAPLFRSYETLARSWASDLTAEFDGKVVILGSLQHSKVDFSVAGCRLAKKWRWS